MKVPYIPQNAPFNGNQRQWLSGFFAGLHTRMLQAPGNGAGASAPGKQVSILFGSQTGTAESVAYDVEAAAKTHGLNAAVYDMDEVELEALAAMDCILIITSTYGEGEMPDNAAILWEAISNESEATMLEGAQFSVLALGDTSYDEFCKAGKLWDEKLEALGAKRIIDRVDCDVDFEELAEEWTNSVIPLLSESFGQDGEHHAVIPAQQQNKPQFNRKNPYPARRLVNRLLSREGSDKEIRHYEISLEGSGLNYEAGDALCIFPTNCPSLVTDVLNALGCKGDEEEPLNGTLMPLWQALTEHLEIKHPSKELLTEIAARSGDQELNSLLESDDKEALATYLWGRDTLDLLHQFPQVEFSAAEFLSLLKPLQHRAYSISSSPNKHPGEVHLTVSTVRYESYGREHKGVCSTYLSDIVTDDTSVRCFFTPNKSFRVPENDGTPVIMVGPGTGIAPFRAFLEEREVRKAEGKNWLFFGDQHRATDFIYEDELQSMQVSGLLTRLDLAFSRDQAEKIYVQDRMREHAGELFQWLEQGAYFYVCGDAYRMARDVDQALHEIIASQGGMTEEQAIEYVNHLKKEKRYVRDVY